MRLSPQRTSMIGFLLLFPVLIHAQVAPRQEDLQQTGTGDGHPQRSENVRRGLRLPAAASADELLEIARVHVSESTINGRKRAIDVLKTALDREPDHIEARLLLADLFQRYARRSAISEFEHVLRLDSTHAAAWYGLGVIAEQSWFEWRDAANMILTPEIYINRQSDLAEYILMLMTGGADEHVMRDYFARKEDNIVRLAHTTHKDFRRATEAFRMTILYDPENVDAAQRLSMLLIHAGDDGAALEMLTGMAKRFPTEKKIQLALALSQYRCGRIADARTSFDRAFRLMTAQERHAYEFAGTFELLRHKHADELKDSPSIVLEERFRDFWATVDPLYLTEENEAEIEHFSRIALAELTFGRPLRGEQGWMTDRGKMLLRFGEPEQRLRLRPDIEVLGARTSKTELWFYPGMITSFTDEFNSGSFRFSSPATGDGSQSGIDGEGVYLDLARTILWNHNPMYRRPSMEVPFSITRFRSNQGNRPTDMDLIISYSLPLVTDTGIGVADTTTALFPNNGGAASDEHHFGFFLLDELGRRMFDLKETKANGRHETTWRGEAACVFAQSVFSGPDSGLCSLEWLRKDDGAAYVQRFPFNLRSLHTRPALSDILLAHEVLRDPEVHAPLRRASFAITPNPSGRIIPGTRPVLYFELYDLGLSQEGLSDFDIEISIQTREEKKGIGALFQGILSAIGIGGERRLLASTGYVTDVSTAQLSLALDLDAYDPGDYLLTVRVIDHVLDRDNNASCAIRLEEQP